VCTDFWLESLKGRNHSEDLGVDGRTVLQDWKGVLSDEDIQRCSCHVTCVTVALM
jgi:hypothetical protein